MKSRYKCLGTSLFIWALLYIRLLGNFAQSCNRAFFPKVIGGATNATEGIYMAYNILTDSLAVGGTSADSSLFSSGRSTPASLLTLYKGS